MSVEVQACARAGRLCPTLLLHDLARAEDRALLTQPWMGHPAAASLGGFPLGGLRLEGAPFAPIPEAAGYHPEPAGGVITSGAEPVKKRPLPN